VDTPANQDRTLTVGWEGERFVDEGAVGDQPIAVVIPDFVGGELPCGNHCFVVVEVAGTGVGCPSIVGNGPCMSNRSNETWMHLIKTGV